MAKKKKKLGGGRTSVLGVIRFFCTRAMYDILFFREAHCTGFRPSLSAHQLR
jgi:hypothetical protein